MAIILEDNGTRTELGGNIPSSSPVKKKKIVKVVRKKGAHPHTPSLDVFEDENIGEQEYMEIPAPPEPSGPSQASPSLKREKNEVAVVPKKKKPIKRLANVSIFTGLERSDFVYFMAKLLSGEGSVLVIDNSVSGDLYNAVNIFDDSYAVEKEYVNYARNIKPSWILFNKFDFVLLYLGNNYDEKLMRDIKKVFVMPDYTPAELSRFTSLDPKTKKVCSLIMRDKASNRISDRAVPEMLDINPVQFKGTISYDREDYCAYLSFVYDGNQKLKNLSPNYMEALAYVLASILRVSTSEAKRIIKAR